MPSFPRKYDVRGRPVSAASDFMKVELRVRFMYFLSETCATLKSLMSATLAFWVVIAFVNLKICAFFVIGFL